MRCGTISILVLVLRQAYSIRSTGLPLIIWPVALESVQVIHSGNIKLRATFLYIRCFSNRGHKAGENYELHTLEKTHAEHHQDFVSQCSARDSRAARGRTKHAARAGHRREHSGP